jgi:hypothetical protein
VNADAAVLPRCFSNSRDMLDEFPAVMWNLSHLESFRILQHGVPLAVCRTDERHELCVHFVELAFF